MKMKRPIKKTLTIIGVIAAVIVLITIACYVIVVANASGRTFDNIEDVPPREYALLLGTSPITPGGARNFYFDNRIRSAVELYKAGKIKRIIASGGNYTQDPNNPHGCDEPRAMRDSLVKYGVPWGIITLDYDGTRTLNSIVKAKEKYGLDSVLIISQKYHNERAIWQAEHYGLHAIGYNAAHSHIRRNRIKNIAREFPARVKLMLDMMFGKKPTFTKDVVETAPGHFEDWWQETDTIPGVGKVVSYHSLNDEGYGFSKVFNFHNGKPFYYNSRHGYFVGLPDGFGYNQYGENIMGAHENEFYNSDSTVVISAYAMYYDAILVDRPHYADSLVLRQKEYLAELGSARFIVNKPDTIIAIGRVRHNNPDNPPADFFMNKWLLKKDIDGRECEMSVTVFYNDTVPNYEPGYLNIIYDFPDSNFLKRKINPL